MKTSKAYLCEGNVLECLSWKCSNCSGVKKRKTMRVISESNYRDMQAIVRAARKWRKSKNVVDAYHACVEIRNALDKIERKGRQ